jgi:hypothetical protein
MRLLTRCIAISSFSSTYSTTFQEVDVVIRTFSPISTMRTLNDNIKLEIRGCQDDFISTWQAGWTDDGISSEIPL